MQVYSFVSKLIIHAAWITKQLGLRKGRHCPRYFPDNTELAFTSYLRARRAPDIV